SYARSNVALALRFSDSRRALSWELLAASARPGSHLSAAGTTYFHNPVKLATGSIIVPFSVNELEGTLCSAAIACRNSPEPSLRSSAQTKAPRLATPCPWTTRLVICVIRPRCAEVHSSASRSFVASCATAAQQPAIQSDRARVMTQE